MNYLDPQLTLLFTSNSATDSKFLERVKDVNHPDDLPGGKYLRGDVSPVEETVWPNGG